MLLSDQTFERTDESFYRSIQKGDELYFRNIPFYAAKYFNGEAIGYHCLCSQSDGVKKFIVFGGSAEGLEEEQMLELCARDCNDTPLENSDLYSGSFLEKMEEKKRVHDLNMPEEVKNAVQTRTITVEDIRRVQQLNPQGVGLIPFIRRLDVDKIQRQLK